jgi:hypothetical protein
MLGAIDPIIIFQIYRKLTSDEIQKIPVGDVIPKATFAVIPIYLSEAVTGIFIESESKNIDINTDPESASAGGLAGVTQKTLGSITTVNLTAKRGSIGLTILLALSEMIFDKVTSEEYEVTYMHGAVTVFGGLIHGFSVEQGTDNDLYKIKLEISKGRPKTQETRLPADPTAERLESAAGATPPAGSSTVTGSPDQGRSVIQPGISTGAGT